MINTVKKIRGDVFIVLLISIIVFFLYSFLFNDWSRTEIGDAERYNGYQTYIIKYSLTHFGQFALWDQLLSSGMSWVSHPGGTLFFPPAWVIMLLVDNIMLGSRLLILIHAIMAAIALYIFLRIMSFARFTSFFMSIIYLSVQYPLLFVANGWFEELFALTLIPLIVGIFWMAIEKKNPILASIAGILMSLNFLGNTYYVFHYITIIVIWIIVAFGVRELFYIFKNKRSLKVFFPFILINLIFWLTFLGISAVKLIPILEFRPLSSREYLPLSSIEAPGNVMNFSFLFNLLRYFLIPVGNNTLVAATVSNMTTFIFVLAFLYTIIKRKFFNLVFFGLFLIGVWGYFANKIPIDFYALMYNCLPGFSSNNYTYRFYIIIYFAFVVCLATGLNLLISNKIKRVKFIGIFIGLFMIITGILYVRDHYHNLKYQIAPDMSSSKNLLFSLSKIVKNAKPDGRVRSTVMSTDFPLTNLTSYKGEIYSIHHSYTPIVPTYQYSIAPLASSMEPLGTTVNRYKILSILNARFQIQDKEGLEFWGCKDLVLEVDQPKNAIVASEDACSFYQSRLTQVVKNQKGAIFHDKEVLPKVTLISSPILLISDNRLNDFSSFIAKRIIFHPEFDIKNLTIFSSNKKIDDYPIDELRKFPILILVDYEPKNRDLFEKTKEDYKKFGKLIELNSKWINYESLHERSGSIWTDKPAWSYSEEDNDKLSLLFKSITKDDSSSNITIKKFTPEDLIFEVQTSKDNMALQFSDSYYPGWKAELDGKKVQVYMADGLVKGVIIPQRGKHIVRMRYSPDSLSIGGGITLVTLLIILIFSFRYLKIKKFLNKKRRKTAK